MSLTELQLVERHTGLGGSDAAPALGLSPYKSALELYLDKREQRGLSPAMQGVIRWGHLLEPVIRQQYSEATQRIVRLPVGTIRHPRHKFMLAHVDGVTDDKRVFEAKTARTADGWGAAGSAEIPLHYNLQVQHYLAVTGFVVADIAVLIGGSDFRMYEVLADPELQEQMIEGEALFWDQIQRGEPPPPDWERTDTTDIVRRLFAGTDGTVKTAGDVEVSYRRTYEHAALQVKAYTVLADGAKAHLLHAMGNSARLLFPEDGMQLQRKQINRKEFTTPASSYIDARFSKLKEDA